MPAFRDFILSENITVSQYLKNINIDKQVIKDAIQVAHLISMGRFHGQYSEKFMNAIDKWIAYNSIKEYFSSEKLDLSDENKRKAAMRYASSRIGGWTRNFAAETWQAHSDFLAAHVNDANLLSKLNNTGYTKEYLKQDDFAWHEKLKLQKAVPGAPGKVIIKLDDVGMPGWTWVSLGRGKCSIEAAAAGHCGNAGARGGDNIVSLRDEQQKVHLTFIVNNKVLGEAKARYNQKPGTTKSQVYNFIKL